MKCRGYFENCEKFNKCAKQFELLELFYTPGIIELYDEKIFKGSRICFK